MVYEEVLTCLAWHDKPATDARFFDFFPAIQSGSTDGRNFVKKAVNWALRNIGKRNRSLNRKAIEIAEGIAKIDSKAARWVAPMRCASWPVRPCKRSSKTRPEG